ncbi:MAG TPA: M56 family metallopeptidase [Thermoanaerobaculia bacterium]|nr:M56 family metallopeptidase [Thermoanaerobaculia bacterium]
MNAAWQVPLVTLAAALGTRLLRSAAARHRLLLAALGCSLVLPFAGSLGFGASRPSMAVPPAASAGISGGAAAWTSLGQAPAASLAPSPHVAIAVAVVYLASVLLTAVRRARSWRRALALRRSALPGPLPEAVRIEAERCRRRLGLGDIVVRLSRAVDSPVTLGTRRPVILLPAGLVGSWKHDQLEAALGHELAHVRRHDFAWNAAAELAALPIVFHPATAWLRRRIRQSRELACDALVAERVLEARTYARALAALARSLAPAPAYTLGVADAGILEERVMSLVTGRSRHKAGVLSSVTAALLLAAASLVAASYAVAVKPGPGADAIVGSWIGRVAQWGDLPSVDLKIAEKDGKLSGRATFYLIHVTAEGRREVGGKDEIDMMEPSFDGRRLAFKLKSPDGKTHAIELRLTGEGLADYVEVGGGAEVGAEGHDLVVKMKRSK